MATDGSDDVEERIDLDDADDDSNDEEAGRNRSIVLWFTAESAAILSFTLAVLSLIGLQPLSLATFAVFDQSGPDRYRWETLLGAGVLLVVAAVAAVLGGAVLRGVWEWEDSAPWAAHLARAGVGVAALSVLLSVVAVIAALVNDPFEYELISPMIVGSGLLPAR